MNELKDTEKKKRKFTIHSSRCKHRTTKTAAAATTTTRTFLIYLPVIHDITRKKLLVEGDTHIEAMRKGQKYFANSTSYGKI